MVNALVVEDEDGIMPSIEDAVVTAREDTLHRAKSLEEARAMFNKHPFGYVLLDLKIPARKNGAFPDKQYGITVLKEIRDSELNPTVPIIAMTSHHSDGFGISPQLHDLGVNACISKPFDEKRPLLTVIEEVLASAGAETTKATKAAAKRRGRGRKKQQPFPGGKLVLFPDRVELCEVKILGNSGYGYSRLVLDLLRVKRRGRFVRISGETLADKLNEKCGGTVTIGTVTGCAKTLRGNIKTRLERDHGFTCGDHDVLVRDEQGYHLNDDKVTVEDGKDEE